MTLNDFIATSMPYQHTLIYETTTYSHHLDLQLPRIKNYQVSYRCRICLAEDGY